ncbi:cyclase family protein [Microbacterium sp. A84]|uniref:cyclase family protein n=1 Tax=Microbacterium sp. A84 TaxID=3450715 RepID=UPI003F43E212
MFELSIPLDATGPMWSTSSTRVRPMHVMTVLPDQWGPEMHGTFGTDDWLFLPLQSGTQWDSLAHVGYDEYFYNGVPMSEVNAGGAARNAVASILPGVVGRGVLLDIPRLMGVDRLDGGQPITPADLEAAEQAQGVRLTTVDVLLLRTGWRAKALQDGWQGWHDVEPGLTLECAEWLHEREVSAVASDNHGIEVLPTTASGPVGHPLHFVVIRDMGMPLGEIFDLEALADDCAEDGQYEVFFSAPPLRLPRAVGSPISPIAVK